MIIEYAVKYTYVQPWFFFFSLCKKTKTKLKTTITTKQKPTKKKPLNSNDKRILDYTQ